MQQTGSGACPLKTIDFVKEMVKWGCVGISPRYPQRSVDPPAEGGALTNLANSMQDLDLEKQAKGIEIQNEAKASTWEQ